MNAGSRGRGVTRPIHPLQRYTSGFISSCSLCWSEYSSAAYGRLRAAPATERPRNPATPPACRRCHKTRTLPGPSITRGAHRGLDWGPHLARPSAPTKDDA